MNIESFAPNGPGIEPRWTSSAKTGVGTSATLDSRVWFTLQKGIVTEVYYPYVDHANIRELQFLVTDGKDFFSTEHHHTDYEVSYLEEGVPAYKVVTTCKHKRYRITKIVITDPKRDTLLLNVAFEALIGKIDDYRLFVYVSPHLANAGSANTAWVGEYKGWPMLFASHLDMTLALCAYPFFSLMTCGYVGTSDGWSELKNKKTLENIYLRAELGNVGIIGEIALNECAGIFRIALGFAVHPSGAAIKARSSLTMNFDRILRHYITGWQEVQLIFRNFEHLDPFIQNLYRTSIMVLNVHRTKVLEGSIIASLSIPWGFSKGDYDLGGYHLIWPRDLVEAAGGLLAAQDIEGARQILFYLMCTQESDGHWAQCMWVEGIPYWSGIQMDETAMPILLADTLKRNNALMDLNPWPMILKAVKFIVKFGPVTQQDRWEEDGGYTSFTLATEIAALLCAADFFEQNELSIAAQYLKETADCWNSQIERWTYVSGTELAKKVGVDGYYVRITPPEYSDASSPTSGFVAIKNRPPNFTNFRAEEIVSTDILSLVRFGLRDANDPRIRNTIKVVDFMLKTETPVGPVWHRYNQDGYGEHADGEPFSGVGRGRGWPLMVGERAHYELALGNKEEAHRLLHVMGKQGNESYLLPEQIWDSEDIPEKGLLKGRPSGSAMPLVWTHAEFIKLVRSLHDNRVFDTPTFTYNRYIKRKTGSPHFFWRFNHKCISMPAQKILRLELLSTARVRFSFDQWKNFQEIETKDTGIGIHFADLPTTELPSGSQITFTFFWIEPQKWEGADFTIKIEP